MGLKKQKSSPQVTKHRLDRLDWLNVVMYRICNGVAGQAARESNLKVINKRIEQQQETIRSLLTRAKLLKGALVGLKKEAAAVQQELKERWKYLYDED